MNYKSTKTFGHNLGLSCAFRQWKADSHCHFIHVYAVAVKSINRGTTIDNESGIYLTINWGGDYDYTDEKRFKI